MEYLQLVFISRLTLLFIHSLIHRATTRFLRADTPIMEFWFIIILVGNFMRMTVPALMMVPIIQKQLYRLLLSVRYLQFALCAVLLSYYLQVRLIKGPLRAHLKRILQIIHLATILLLYRIRRYSSYTTNKKALTIRQGFFIIDYN